MLCRGGVLSDYVIRPVTMHSSKNAEKLVPSFPSFPRVLLMSTRCNAMVIRPPPLIELDDGVWQNACCVLAV